MGAPGRIRGAGPALAILLLAPFLGEVMSTSTPPLDLLLPWNLPFQSALYGCGALVVRELTHRHRLALPGLCLLAAAYAVFEEALVVRSWFDPGYHDDVGLGSYSRVWDTNLLLASHLTAFHVTVSICSSIVIVERLFPARRGTAWVGSRGLVVAGFVLLVLVPLSGRVLGTYGDASHLPAAPQVAALGLLVLLVVAAFLVPRRDGDLFAPRSSPRFVGLLVFVCTAAQFVLTYAIPSAGLPWPVGTAIALAPILVGILVVRRLARRSGGGWPDALRVVTGILAFFVLLDLVIGLGGRYDLSLGALATAWLLWWLARHPRSAVEGGG